MMAEDRRASSPRPQGLSPLVEASLATDLENLSTLDEDVLEVDDSNDLLRPPSHSLANFYRRPSTGATGSRLPVFGNAGPDHLRLSAEERERFLREERNLLRDSHVIPPKKKRAASADGYGTTRSARGSIERIKHIKSTTRDEELGLPSETTPLIGGIAPSSSGTASPDIHGRWEDAIDKGLVQTTWQRETKVLARNSAPLIITFLLQYSLNVASIFTVGHIGKVELGAVSLASSKFSPVSPRIWS